MKIVKHFTSNGNSYVVSKISVTKLFSTELTSNLIENFDNLNKSTEG